MALRLNSYSFKVVTREASGFFSKEHNKLYKTIVKNEITCTFVLLNLLKWNKDRQQYVPNMITLSYK